ncbi:MAG: hypothetical protein SWH61_11370 [Thermodesulfobacteriota bacterium]|nr:hypothetical protein [Thermodesulfobacteriota bacterium]
MKRTTKTFTVTGKIKVEERSYVKEKVAMTVFARVGRRTLASTPVNKNGTFTLKFDRKGDLAPANMELVVGPPVQEGRLTKAATQQIPISANEWKKSGSNFSVEKEVFIPGDIIVCWLPREIKICGVVCKETPIADSEKTRCCPVPYAKVEIYDVDPLIFTLDHPYTTVSAADSVIEKPFMEAEIMGEIPRPPQPSPSPSPYMSEAVSEAVLDESIGYIDIAKRFEYLPLYSKDLLAETYTDQCGEFCITFTWYPGCINPDIEPDLIFKVSQTFNDGTGPVTHTLYAEGYSDTRWDTADYHWVKLDVDDDVFVACNPDCHPLLDRRALFLGVGDQEIYNHIEQGDDPSRACGFVYNGNFLKSPFGAMLDIRGVFGSKVEEMGERWYRISYAKINNCASKPADDDPTAWTPLTDTLTDTKYYWDAGEGTLHYESVALGPHSLSGHPDAEFYKIRNTQDDDGHDLYWQNQNVIAEWQTVEKIAGEWTGKVDDGLYVLKMEVFEEDGSPASDVLVGDDEANFAYLYMYINNKIPMVEIKEIYNGGDLISMACGSFEHVIGEQVMFLVDAYHPDNHLRYWHMTYQIGYGSSSGHVDRLSDGTVWAADPLLEDFRGKDNQNIIWTNFDADLGLTADPPSPCSTFGIAIQLSAATKTINGYNFLGSSYGHYQEVHAGLAVHHDDSGGE